jgi:hypothetical protein
VSMEREDMEEERRGGEGGEEGGGLATPSSVSADSAYAVRWAQSGLLLCGTWEITSSFWCTQIGVWPPEGETHISLLESVAPDPLQEVAECPDVSVLLH